MSGNVPVALLGLVGRLSPAAANLGLFRTARRARWFEIRGARFSVDAGRNVSVALLRRIGGLVPDALVLRHGGCLHGPLRAPRTVALIAGR
jgi:hypothetical protein